MLPRMRISRQELGILLLLPTLARQQLLRESSSLRGNQPEPLQQLQGPRRFPAVVLVKQVLDATLPPEFQPGLPPRAEDPHKPTGLEITVVPIPPTQHV